MFVMLFLEDNCLHMLCLNFPFLHRLHFLFLARVHYTNNVPVVHMKNIYYLITFPLCITLGNHGICGDNAHAWPIKGIGK